MIIGIVGKAGSGKDTVGEYLVRKYGFIRLGFADKVKEIARDCFLWDGQKDAKGRRLLQVIGTECGRAYDNDLWLKYMLKAMNMVELKHFGEFIDDRKHVRSNIVVTDIRFQNEENFIRNYGGFVIRVTGRMYKLNDSALAHASEMEQEKIVADYTIDNSKDIGYLYWNVDSVYNEIMKRK
jgi:hypothetical protein